MLETADDGPLLTIADGVVYQLPNNQDDWRLKDVLAWVFPICNFTLELPSTVFDQLSSKDHPQYALIAMLFSFIALMSCIAELIFNGKMERVTWQWRDTVPWFYCRPTDKLFGTL
ncbi:Serine/threonine-protein kinase PBS1 isoform 1 [Theobroma cacao]|uniref:Serine/threonine-protein kinase PBS1 isoform 1 n=1 Tax=Theobroma cacao TaxID=3641 RepID=A0A061DYE4_THECC|nr:Serine/threonine-protein kinase PBS1 isoform 1 [Theobroma cacao]EOX97101.1 Serine/threonine-protein kinase PBS1 isoform 1 [Theobroma cacao]EOX97102.1 Serine/threonine-protein kinase PBS1 isoform 1 [Theobroma cacao]